MVERLEASQVAVLSAASLLLPCIVLNANQKKKTQKVGDAWGTRVIARAVSEHPKKTLKQRSIAVYLERV